MSEHDSGVTLGEVYRKLLEQSADLAEIKSDVKRQNGTVWKHEARISVLEDRGTRDGAARVTGVGGILSLVGYAIYHYFSK